MPGPVLTTIRVHCSCGQVVAEALGPLIACVSCYCDDCQEGARQLQSLPDAPRIQEPDGGTAYIVYRKDRLRFLQGQSLLKPHKIRPDSATNRVFATCCNTAVLLNFDDGKHWVDLYRSQCQGSVPHLQWRICTKFRPDGHAIPADVPAYHGYPIALLFRLIAARAAMLITR